MSRKQQFPPPIYSRRGKDYTRVFDGHGNATDIPLGPTGSDESRARYARIVQRISEGKPAIEPPAAAGGDSLTVAELAARWWEWIDRERRYLHPDGRPTSERAEHRTALKALRRLFGHVRATDFTLDQLEEFRASLISGSWLTAGERAERLRWGRGLVCSRSVAERRTRRVLAVFRWAKKRYKGLRPTYADLCEIDPLPRDMPGVKETEEVEPVPETALAATLPHLNHVVRALVELQLLTGARPGELVGLRPCDIDRTGTIPIGRGETLDTGGRVWTVRLGWHKTRRRGGQRVLLLGPQAQAVLAPLLLSRALDQPLFSPAEAMARRREVRRAARRSRVQPSQRDRRRPGKARCYGASYDVRGYAHAIRWACKRHGLAHWHPHQLRHNAASRLVEQFGWAVAQTILGHRTLAATRVYGRDPWKAAAEAMAQAG